MTSAAASSSCDDLALQAAFHLCGFAVELHVMRSWDVSLPRSSQPSSFHLPCSACRIINIAVLDQWNLLTVGHVQAFEVGLKKTALVNFDIQSEFDQ